MKSINRNLLLLVLLAATAVTSCKKKEDNTSTLAQVSDMDKSGVSMFAALRSAPQVFTVTAGVGTKIKGAQGTLLVFYPNSFKDKDGNIISSGSITIELTEMYKTGDMIANRTSTATSGGVLTSGGEVNIKATMGGQEVFANKYKLGFKAAAAALSKPMELYYGDAGNADSITFWGITKTGTQPGTSYITDTSFQLVEAPYFMFDSCTSFTIINCDHPYDSTSKFVTINVVFPDNTFKSNIGSLAIAYPTLNVSTLTTGYEFNSASHTMTFKGWAPTGPACKFVLLIPKDVNNWYYYEQPGTVAGDMSINANVALIPLAEALSKLHAL